MLHAGNAERGSVPASVLAVQTPAAAAAASAVPSACWSSAGSDAPRGERCIQTSALLINQAKLRIYTTIQTFSMVSSSFYCIAHSQ